MPKCSIDGREVEVAPGTTVIRAALELGIEIPHFCWHPDLPVDGNCRMCLVEVEKMPKLQIACNTQVADGMVIRTDSEAAKQAHRTTLEFLLVNHPIDCPVCDQAGECYLQDHYMDHGGHDSKIELEEKVRKRKVVDLGPIMLDAERCVLCSRCIRFESEVTGTNSFEFVNRGDHTQISTYQNRPITHGYAGNLADVCPVGALLSHDFRFRMRVWFLESTDSICPGCSTGCNIHLDHRDGEAQRFRPRRNVEVNKSWMCDEGRALYAGLGSPDRLSQARLNGEASSLDDALDAVAEALRDAGSSAAILASPRASNEDLFALRRLADVTGAKLDFRVGDPQDKLEVREDEILLRADRNPNTRGCLDLEMGRSGVPAILGACRSGQVRLLIVQDGSVLADEQVSEAASVVPRVVVMATHEAASADSLFAVLPAASWAECEGTFTNYARRVQRFKRAFAPPSAARPRWELAAMLLRRLGEALPVSSARDVFRLLAQDVSGYASLSHQTIGAGGRAVGEEPGEAATVDRGGSEAGA